MKIAKPSWNPAKVYYGDGTQRCFKCGEFIQWGEWVKVHRHTGTVWHDDEAEDAGAYLNGG